ncbi:hypothetical protein OC846_002781 [Tilletia horrida]|uniref:Major facilitator superfamily (MFS) profile domain-containing protein n=1 Tax=Tilletia horrida TaxID=155126 RepID=A0AAN6JSB6_9BASI|nr:hypothetical protein OC846_002781 [Tilletia horrida]KAK0568448.1 hypothetical protein OC861_001929 [Tilletia horrida]
MSFLKVQPHIVRTYAISALTAICGLQYGVDTGSIGSIISMKSFIAEIGELSDANSGIFVASVLFAASGATLVSGDLADRFSRRRSISVGAALMCLGALISASAHSLVVLFVARVIYGLGIGSTFALSTLYLCEIAQPSLRGVIGCMPQLFTAGGVAVGYFIAFGSSRLNSTLSWRTPFVVQCCTALILFVGSLFIPYSPRWLAEHGRAQEAREVLVWLRENEEVAQVELDEILKSKNERALLNQTTSILDAFRPPYARRTVLCLYLMAAQQTTGVDFILYYAPKLFRQAGFDGQLSAFLSSAVVGLLCFVMTLPGQIFLDRMGRKMPLVIGGTVMSLCFFLIGAINASGHVSSPGVKWVIMFAIYTFISAFSLTWGCVLKVMVSEILPTHIRARTSSMSQFSNWSINSVVALTAPAFLGASTSAPYMLYASLTLLASLVCAAMLPDTSNLSLEEIDRRFDEDSKKVKVFAWATGRAAPNGDGSVRSEHALRMRVRA